MGQLIGGFVTNITNIFTGFGNLLSATFQNLIQFDLFDSSNRVKDAFGQLTGSVDDMGKELEEAIRLITTPLTEGIVTGEDAPATGTQRTSEGAYEPGAPLQGGGGADFWTLTAVAALEDGDPQGRADVAQSIYNRAASGVFGTSSIKGLILSGNGKQYEPVGRAVKQFKAIQDRESAIVAIMAANKLSRQQAERMIDATASAITNPSLKKKAAEFVENRTDFLGAGLTPSRQSSTTLRRRTPSDNIFGNYVGPASYQYGLRTRGQGAATPNIQMSSPSQPQLAQRRGVTTTVRDEVNIAGASGGTPSVGLSREEGAQYLARRGGGRKHAGVDIGTSGQRGFYVSFKQSGKVTYARNNGRGYGNLVIIKSGNTEFYFAHLASILVKEGQQYSGETIGEIGKTGGNYPIHLHFEARPNGVPTNPKPYLGFLSIGRQLTGISGKPINVPTPSTVSPAQIASSQTQQQRQQVSQQLSQDRTGPTVIFQQPPEPEPQGPSYSSGAPSMMPLQVDEFTLVNNFMKKKLLLDLAYL
jgi:murein DD-endopeptidase MepM/ murein hydrolase activator NlpD